MLAEIAKKTLRPIIRRFGYDIVARRDFGRDPFDDIRSLIRRDDPILMDVGGNEGQTVRKLRSRYPHGTIHTFEPSKPLFERLVADWAHDPKVTAWNAAVGAGAGKMILHENTFSVMNSLLPLGPEGWGDEVRTVEVDVVRLDDFADENNISHIDLLKSDTQGYDMHVLEGANRLLADKKVNLALCEIVLSDMYKDIPRIDKLLEYMFDLDYKLVSFYDQFYQSKALGWTDALFAQRDFLDRVAGAAG